MFIPILTIRTRVYKTSNCGACVFVRYIDNKENNHHQILEGFSFSLQTETYRLRGLRGCAPGHDDGILKLLSGNYLPNNNVKNLF
jgi:hypothetical protein